MCVKVIAIQNVIFETTQFSSLSTEFIALLLLCIYCRLVQKPTLTGNCEWKCYHLLYVIVW